MKIAIRGHESRGKEVIQILENLGGENRYDQSGSNERFVYFINNVGFIYSITLQMCSNERRIYTLEEFEKEFPFKIGDEVMFPVKTGWASGKITGLTYVGDQLKYEVDNRIAGYCYIEPHKLSLYPMKEERNITLTLEKAKEWYKKGGELKEIALQAFTEKELNPLPRSWEEFCRNNPVQVGECWLENCDKIRKKELSTNEARIYKNWIPSQKSAEAHLAMIQLEQLRDCWRQGWEPEYHITSYAIKRCNDEIHIIQAYSVSAFLSFPTQKMAEEFLECFRDLIEKAGDLI